MQRSTVLTLLLVCSVAAVAWVWWSQAHTPLAPPVGPSATSEPAGAGPPPDEPDQPSVEVPPDAPLVTITVVAKEQFVAPPAAVFAEAGDGTPLPARIVAGVGSGFDARILRPGIALLQIDWQAGGTLLRQQAVQPDPSRPARVGARVVVRGQVVDGGQKAVRTAQVWFGESLADGTRREYPVDVDGWFEAEVPAGDGIPFVVGAPGYASTWRAISVTPTSGELKTQLMPATRVRVQLAARALEIERARAFVLPARKVSSGLSQWPFFRQCLDDGYPVDAKGTVQIDDLPTHGEVVVLVRHPFAALMKPKDVRLEQREVQVVVPLRFTEQRRQAQVVDEQGDGLDGVSVWVRDHAKPLARRASLRLLPPHLDLRGTCFDRTESQGLLSVGMVTDASRLSLRAHGRAGRDVKIAAAWPERVVLPEWRGGDALLEVQPPIDGRAWQFASNLGEGISGGCEADQPCSLSLPYAGRFDITITVVDDGEETYRHNLSDVFLTGPLDVATRN